MAKNIVICLDGTGRQFDHSSNVVVLLRLLEHQPGEQIVYYDPGVGTMGDPGYKTWIGRKINRLLGLAFGTGLQKNVLEAYTYLMEHYEEGDKVFVFGFSRGAYTARVLAAFIHECGLFPKGSHNMIPYAIRHFRTKVPTDPAKETDFWKLHSKFRKTYSRSFPKPGSTVKRDYQLRIELLGLFDTVKSYGWLWNPGLGSSPARRGERRFRHEKRNMSVRNVRQALAIDERRAFYRQMHWISSRKDQCKEVWFVGSHGDVGGGHAEPESGLAKIPLQWMVEEARPLGLKVDEYYYQLYALGKLADGGAADDYSGPDPTAKAHESLRGLWWLVQFIPRAREAWEEHRWRRTIKSQKERTRSGDSEPVLVHESVVERMRAVPRYRPWNLYPKDPRFFAELLMERGELPKGSGVEATGMEETDPLEDRPAGQAARLLGARENLTKTLKELGIQIERTQSDSTALAENAVTEEQVRSIVNDVFADVKAAAEVTQGETQALTTQLSTEVSGLATRLTQLSTEVSGLATRAALKEAVGEITERLERLEQRGQVKLPVPRKDREEIESELIAGDLYRAVLRETHSGGELARQLRGRSEEEREKAIRIFVSGDRWAQVETAVKDAKPKEWRLLRDQLWRGLLQREFSSWDTTRQYDDKLKGAKRKDGFVEIILELIRLPEYRSRLESRIDERLNRDWIAELRKQAPKTQ